MAQLKLNELREGVLYYCPLSKKTVLVTSVKNETEKTAKIFEWINAECVFFDETNQRYETFLAWDFQLQELAIAHT